MQVASTYELERITESLGSLVRGLDPGAFAVADGVRLVEIGTQIERLGSAVRMAGAGMVARAGTWEGQGDRTAAQWLARKSGTSMSDAIGTVKAAEQLASLPATAAAMRRGELSAEQAKEIAGAAIVNPAAEQQLLAHAQVASVNELRDEARRVRAAADPDTEATARMIHAARSARVHRESDSTWVLTARGTAAAGAQIIDGLDHRADQLFREAYREGRREPRDAYVFDALVELCTEGGAPEGRSPLPKGANAKVLARVDWPALVRGHTIEGETCEIVGVGPVPVSVVRELSKDAFVAAILTNGTDICSVTHLGRKHTALQVSALQWRDRAECARLGCNKTVRLEKDHRADWADTHVTEVDQSDLYCHDDHKLKSEKGWMLVEGTGKRLMVPPEHPDHPMQVAVRTARTRRGMASLCPRRARAAQPASSGMTSRAKASTWASPAAGQPHTR